MRNKYSWIAISFCFIIIFSILAYWITKPKEAIYTPITTTTKTNTPSSIGNLAKNIFISQPQIQNIRLLGIAKNQNRQYIILNINNKSEIFKINDSIPNIGTIISINKDFIEIDNNSNIQKIMLEEAKKNDFNNSSNIPNNFPVKQSINFPNMEQENINEAKIMDKQINNQSQVNPNQNIAPIPPNMINTDKE